MMAKIKSHFMKIGPRRFVVGAVIILIILDLINLLYLKLYWVHKNFSILMVEKLAQGQSLNFSEFSAESIQEFKGVVDNSFFFFLFIILINNLFFYAFYLRKKLWAQGYVLFYTISSSIMAVTFLIEGAVMGWNWFIYNIFTMVLYLYLYFGAKVLKYETTDAIPAHGTKGR